MVQTRQLVDARTDWSGLENYGSSHAGATHASHSHSSESQTGSSQPIAAQANHSARRLRRQAAGGEHLALARTIESEIIPRLMLTHRIESGRRIENTQQNSAFSDIPLTDSVATLAELALDHPMDVGLAYLQSLQLKGVSADTIFLDVIGPAARRLGDMWKSDIRDFTDVTVGLTRLQRMMCELTPAFVHQEESRFSTRSALLVPCPGEQHSLGLHMVQEFFRRAGWHVHPGAPTTLSELKDTVRRHRFDVVGFSSSCEIFVDAMKAAIQLTRRHSKNRNVGIIVGGRLFNDHPELVATVGADATAADGRDAIQRLPALLGLTAAIC